MTIKPNINTPKLTTIAHIKAQQGGVLVLQTQANYLEAIDLGASYSGDQAQKQQPLNKHTLQAASNRANNPKENSANEMASPSYGDFNLGLHVGDNPLMVHQHRSALISAINAHLAEYPYVTDDKTADSCANPLTRLHWLNQVHGNEVLRVDDTLTLTVANADAMVTQEIGCGLAIMTADCVPIVLYQPSTGQIAAIHAGWQGLASGVIKATWQLFQAPGEIQAWIGACISQDNYEVGADVVDKLVTGCLEGELVGAMNASQLRQMLTNSANNGSTDQPVKDKYWLDLPKLTQLQLTHLGITVASDNVIECSYANADRYYSYRRQTHEHRPATGRMALVIARIG